MRKGIATVLSFAGYDEATNQSLEVLGDVLDDFLVTFARKITEEVRQNGEIWLKMCVSVFVLFFSRDKKLLEVRVLSAFPTFWRGSSGSCWATLCSR